MATILNYILIYVNLKAFSLYLVELNSVFILESIMYSIFVDETIRFGLYPVDHEGRGYKQMFLLKGKRVYVVILIILLADYII